MTVRAWAELLRVSALFTVPGDALAGAAASGRRPDRGTALAVGASLCLYEAGMALNDWADREEDAIDRPHRPIPSGRIAPAAALAAAGALTAAGLGLAARAGRPALAVAAGLAATVWAYDLRLKHTPAGPAAMAAARGLDLLLGTTATGATGRTTGPGPTPDPAAGGSVLAALPAAGLLGAHTYAVTAVSRHEAHGGSTTAPLTALAAVAALGAAALRIRQGRREDREPAQHPAPGGQDESPLPLPRPAYRSPVPFTVTAPGLVRTALTASYVRTAAVPLLHAALNPSPLLTQRAVGGGIRAMIPLQAALAARTGAVGTALAVMGLVPIARTLARKVSPT
ncbi:hypothetical protein GCM10015535_01060 [Streptomyces gelaticus]|uniref:Prenyltransferase n=1 Tax=Streptomyces gelaticus TaxID=285446 RepID=A0ABQ2VPX6_9ACTN|nr:UbiA family prenyltransferase [Streptomyces gelaticus]GGV73624.1 hypothetical protein GCM10015535_01060 [Streptomyces gelaticus]